MESIWTKTSRLPSFPSQNGDMQTDVLIIGGGIAGILCAKKLQELGIPCLIAEAHTIGSGTTAGTTAKITVQHGLLYHKLLKRYGCEKTCQYLQANQQALNQYRQLCAGISCDFSLSDSYVYSRDRREALDEELLALDTLHFPAEFAGTLPLPFLTAGAVKFPDQAQFHPLKFLSAVCAALSILEHTPVRKIGNGYAVTDWGRIRAEKIIVATHFPILNRHGSYFLKQYQHRSYCLALKNAGHVGGMYVDEQQSGLSFRDQEDLLILSGGSHRTGKTGGGWDELTDFVHAHYPAAQIQSQWATQDCMTLDAVPYIGQYSALTPDMYVATGFNKWGMTSAMVSANILTDLITGKENPFAKVFSPSRSILHRQLGTNAIEAVSNLLTFSQKRCSHMGCALKWNAQEHSWDCPCHGSRFSHEGALLDNPATRDLKK